MTQIIISILAFLFAIAILVVFHEYGHFWTARRFGIKVLRFSVGFGRIIWKKQSKSGVEYVLSAIPLGGYVKMLDEREADVAESDKPYAFNRKPLWIRFLVVLAGPLFNFIFAFLAFWLMLMMGIDTVIARIGEITPDSIAYHAGMEAGGDIIAVDGASTVSWQDVHHALLLRIGDKTPLNIQMKAPNGELDTYHLNLTDWELRGDKPNPVLGLGIKPYRPPIPPIIEEVVDDSPASLAGIQPGDKLLSLNNQPIESWQDFSRIITKLPNVTAPLTVERNGNVLSLEITPQRKISDTGDEVGFAGLMVNAPPLPQSLLTKQRLGPIAALGAAYLKTQNTIVMTFQLLGKLVVGKLGIKHLSGPIAIAEGAGATVVIGIPYFLSFLALISVSLGVINLLPIPMLDGGHLLFYVVEGITGRPVSEQIQLWSFKLGFMLLIFLMVVAFYNDLVRFL